MRKTENLRVATMAMQIAEATYHATRSFPPDEKFGLVSQMRRAAVSIGSNISEGCGRSSETQLLYFCQVASGSASELEFQARLALRLTFGVPSELERLCDMLGSERRMLGRLSTRMRTHAKDVVHTGATGHPHAPNSAARSADAG